MEFERIRDFIVLHYCTSQREGELWRHCRGMALPDTLTAKIEAYKARGAFVRYEAESFFDPSWLCMYDGFGIVPRAYDPFADNFALDDLKDLTRNIRADVKAMAMTAPLHADFIKKHCAAVA
ncbi:MAG: tryptophan 7-halogenase [Asticcacaulis sp.]